MDTSPLLLLSPGWKGTLGRGCGLSRLSAGPGALPRSASVSSLGYIAPSECAGWLVFVPMPFPTRIAACSTISLRVCRDVALAGSASGSSEACGRSVLFTWAACSSARAPEHRQPGWEELFPKRQQPAPSASAKGAAVAYVRSQSKVTLLTH